MSFDNPKDPKATPETSFANTLKPPEKQLKTVEGTTLPTLTVKAPKQQPLGFAQYNPETLAKKDEKVTPKSLQQVQKENDANDMANTAYHAADTDPQAAMLLAQKAAQLHPEQYKDYENTLGRYAAVKAGNMPQAEKYSDAAIKTSSTVENLKWGVYTAQTPDKKLQYANKALSMSTSDDKELDDQAYIADLKSEQNKEIGYITGCLARLCELYEMAHMDDDTADAIRELTKAVKELKE